MTSQPPHTPSARPYRLGRPNAQARAAAGALYLLLFLLGSVGLLFVSLDAPLVGALGRIAGAALFGVAVLGAGALRTRSKIREAADRVACLRCVADEVAEAVFVLDRWGRVLFANREAATLATLPPGELLGRAVTECVPAAVADLLCAGNDRNQLGAEQWVELSAADDRCYAVRRIPVPVRAGTGETLVLVRGLTEQRRTQRAAERSAARLRAVLGSLADGVVVADAGGNLLDWNLSALRMHGYERVEQVRRNAAEFPDTIVLAPVGGAPLRFDEWPISRLLRGETVDACELVVRRTDAPCERVLQFSGARVPGADGGTELVVVTLHDVTDRRRAEDELRASEQRFRTFADHAADAFFLQDDRGVVLDTNRQALVALGYEREELIGRTPLMFVPHLCQHQLDALLARLDAGETLALEGRHRRKDGHVFPVELRIRPFVAGGRRLAVALARDVTERIAAQEALRLREESYRLLFESNPLPMWVYHTETLAFLAVNRAAVAKYGYAPDEFLAMTIRDIRPAEDVKRVETAVAAVAGRASDSGLWRHRLKDGTPIQARVSSHPIEFQGRPGRLVMAQDVTAQLTAEQALRESEERLRRTLEASATGLWGWDLDSGAVAWHADRIPALSHPDTPFDGTVAGVDRVLHPEDRERVWATARRALADGTLFECEFRVAHPDGPERWVASRGRAVGAADGHPRGMLGTITDVTARKTAELELQRTRAVLQNLVDHSPALIFMTDADGRYLLFNPRCAAVLGVRAEDALGKTAQEVFPPALARRFTQHDRDTLAGGLSRASEEVLHTPDGPVHVSVVRFPVTDAGGRVIALGGVATDVTLRKRAEDDLRAREELFRLLADESPHIVWVSHTDGRPEYINSRWREYSGQTAGQTDGSGWLDAVHPDDRDGYVASWREALARGTEHETQMRLRRADGAYRWFLSRAKPVRGGAGQPPRWFGASTDIEEQKRREDSLLQADSHKDAFLATLAHELRNPLAPIADVVQLLGTDDIGRERRREIRDLLASQVRLLTRLVDDLADLSRVRRGAVALRFDTVALGAVLRTSVDTSAPHVRAAGHRLSVEVPPEPVLVRGDAVRLSQVVSNLLTNAAKYTPPGGNVWLTLARDGARALVRVRDDGAGIAPPVLPRVFDMFVQEGRLQERAPGGLGIGLTLVRQIVELHGGAVEAHSAGVGCGAEFVVRLPLAPPSAGSESEPVLPAPRALRVLVVDDNEAVARSFAWVLSGSGHEVAVGHNSETALALVHSFRPDAVLLDLGLPGVGGCSVARAIRELPNGRGLLLVAATGWGTEADRQQTRAAGFDHHLTKPVDHGALAAILAAVVPGGTGVRNADAHPDAPEQPTGSG